MAGSPNRGPLAKTPMRIRQSETLLLLPLLPILIAGMVPMLLFGFLGFAGLALLGVLMVSAGLGDMLDANGDFNERTITHGYVGEAERTIQANTLHARHRFAMAICASGLAMIAAGCGGFVYLG